MIQGINLPLKTLPGLYRASRGMRAEHLRTYIYIWGVCIATWRFICSIKLLGLYLILLSSHFLQKPWVASIYKKQRGFEQCSEHIFFPQEFCHFPGGVRKDLYTKYTRKGPAQSDSMVSPPSLMFLKPLCPEQRAHSRYIIYFDYIYSKDFQSSNDKQEHWYIYIRDSFMALYEGSFNKSWRNSFIGSVDDHQLVPFVRHIIFVPKFPVVPSEMGTVSIPNFEDARGLFWKHPVDCFVAMFEDLSS